MTTSNVQRRTKDGRAAANEIMIERRNLHDDTAARALAVAIVYYLLQLKVQLLLDFPVTQTVVSPKMMPCIQGAEKFG